MKINRMNGSNQRHASIQPGCGIADALFPAEFRMQGRLKVHRTIRMEKSVLIEMWGARCARPVLRYANPVRSPQLVGSGIGAVTRRAGGNGVFVEKLAIELNRPADALLLLGFRKKALGGRLLGIPIFVADPGHAPVNVRCFRLPQRTHELTALSFTGKGASYGRLTKVRSAVQGRSE